MAGRPELAAWSIARESIGGKTTDLVVLDPNGEIGSVSRKDREFLQREGRSKSSISFRASPMGGG
jgi:hypothetical protein